MFDLKVDSNGYAWWYLDAISDDHQYAVTIIAFIGSVFSPYYKKVRQRSLTNPLQHCAINAIVYGKNVGRWTMTERSASAVHQSADRLQIGPSKISVEQNILRIHIDEVAVPVPRKLQGEILVTLPSVKKTVFKLDRQGKHQWTPIAPRCRVEVCLSRPKMQWQGDGYVDHNRGTEPIEQGFTSWNWSRLNLENGDTVIIYDRILHDLTTANLLLTYDSSDTLVNEEHGQAALHQVELEQTTLPKTPIWRIPRSIRCDQSIQPSVVRTLEDTPFYSRSELEGTFGGILAKGIHESVSLRRFVNPIVQLMLPFRMPRRR